MKKHNAKHLEVNKLSKILNILFVSYNFKRVTNLSFLLKIFPVFSNTGDIFS